jgi:hypothetical protein
MWNYFKNKKLKKEQEKLLAEKKVAELKSELKRIDEKCSTIGSENYKRTSAEEMERNSTCPKCKSKNVNDRIKRQQGEIKGDFEGSGWSMLTFGSSHSSGRIRGKMDTNEVNKCNDCQHEWKKHKATHTWSGDVLKNEIESVRSLLDKYYEAENCKFDALDLEEKYSSLEEKKNALTKSAKEYWLHSSVKRFWEGTTLDAFNALAKKHLSSWSYEYLVKSYNEELLLSFGFKKR